MNRYRTFQVCLSLALIVFSAAALSAQSADELLKFADDIFDIDRMYQKSSMTISRNGNTQPVQKMESWFLNDDGEAKSLSVFLAPARVKGTAYLTLGEGLWVRFGSTGRVRKLSSSAKKNSAAGSDFSYIDMGEGNEGYSDKYTAALDGSREINGVECFRIILTPKPGEDVYEKVVAYIQKNSYRYSMLELWDDGAHIKTMTMEDYREQDGLVYPFTIRMTSRTRDSETVIQTEMLEVNSSRVKPNLFTQSYLKNIR